MKQIKLWMTVAAITFGTLTTMTSCSNDDNEIPSPTPVQPATVSCVKPDYLKAGDRVALISPSYYTPMENIEKTADVVRVRCARVPPRSMVCPTASTSLMDKR